MVPTQLLRTFMKEYRACLAIILVSTTLLAALTASLLSGEEGLQTEVKRLVDILPLQLAQINTTLHLLVPVLHNSSDLSSEIWNKDYAM